MTLASSFHKHLIALAGFVFACNLLSAQSPTVPNTGANTTLPPMPTYSSPANTLSNPTNSTVPGANGSYTVDLSKPDMTSPPVNSYNTPYQPATPGNSYTPPAGTPDRSTEGRTKP